jgi:cytochrome c553
MMKHLILLMTGLCLVAPLATAEPSSEVAFDAETRALLAAADPQRGEALANKGRCHRCHGEAGVSDDPVDANIAGLRASYSFKQLKDYQAGSRSSRDMKKQTRKLDDQQMADLSVWFASLAPAQREASMGVDESVRRLVFRGDPQRMIKACSSCHGRDGRGGQYDHPAIAGQNRDYFVETLVAFKEGDRTNDVYSRMRLIAEALTDAEIEGLAAYYAAAVSEAAAE